MKNNIYIVANFGEIFLKGANVSFFEEILYINLFEKVEHLKSKIVFEKKSGGAFFMKLKKDITESEIVEIEKAVATTPGFSTYYRAYFCDTDLEDIIKTSVMVAEKFLKSNPDIKTFGISTKKTEKNIGPKSNEVNVKVGSVI
jgi:adenylyl- and sulfurtransferase ThiI